MYPSSVKPHVEGFVVAEEQNTSTMRAIITLPSHAVTARENKREKNKDENNIQERNEKNGENTKQGTVCRRGLHEGNETKREKEKGEM